MKTINLSTIRTFDVRVKPVSNYRKIIIFNVILSCFKRYYTQRVL